MPQCLDDRFVLIKQNGIGVFAGKLQLEKDDLVFIGAFGGYLETQHTVIPRYCHLQQSAAGKQAVEQGVKGCVVALKRTLAGCFVDKAVPTGHVEKVALFFVKYDFDGIVLDTSCTRDKDEVVQTFGDGLEFGKFHSFPVGCVIGHQIE